MLLSPVQIKYRPTNLNHRLATNTLNEQDIQSAINIIKNKKTHIILFNEQHGQYTLFINDEDGKNVFDRDRCTNLLQAIEPEGKIYTYDDITHIYGRHVRDIDYIVDLPINLLHFELKITTVQHIVFPTYSTNIKTIIIDKAFLTEIPDMQHLTKLKDVKIIDTPIAHILPNRLPQNLENLFMKNVRLNNYANEKINIPANCYKNINYIDENNIQKTDNGWSRNKKYAIYNPTEGVDPIMHPDEIPEPLRPTYTTTINRPMTEKTYEEYNKLWQSRANINAIAEINKDNKTILSNQQTVHVSSICDAVYNSIVKIKNNAANVGYVSTSANDNEKNIHVAEFKRALADVLNKYYVDSNLATHSRPTWITAWQTIFDNIVTATTHVKNVLINAPTNAKHYGINTTELMRLLTQWLNCETVYEKHKITYKDLFVLVWHSVKMHPMKDDLLINIAIELNNSIGVCFVGRFNRLVNSLCGFVEGVQVGISIKQQLQLEIAKTIKLFTDKKINFEECERLVKEILVDPILQEDETITESYKQSWIDALEIYRE